MTIARDLDKLVTTLQAKGVLIRPYLQPGLSRSSIQSALSSIKINPTDDLYQLYEWHNGVDLLNTPVLLFGEHQFLPLSDAIQEHYELITYYSQVPSLINVSQCFPVASFQGSTWNVYCDSNSIDGLLCPIVEIYHGISIVFENIKLMAQTVNEWFLAGVYDSDPANDNLRFAIRRRMNPRIPYRTTSL